MKNIVIVSVIVGFILVAAVSMRNEPAEVAPGAQGAPTDTSTASVPESGSQRLPARPPEGGAVNTTTMNALLSASETKRCTFNFVRQDGKGTSVLDGIFGGGKAYLEIDYDNGKRIKHQLISDGQLYTWTTLPGVVDNTGTKAPLATVIPSQDKTMQELAGKSKVPFYALNEQLEMNCMSAVAGPSTYVVPGEIVFSGN